MGATKFRLVFATLCLISALLGIADTSPTPTFPVRGRVYCDTCRAGFVHEYTEYLEGARVRLECKQYGSNEITHWSDEAVTDGQGNYVIDMPEDHQEETCEVILVEIPREDCKEIPADHGIGARVMLTRNSGMSSEWREANPIGFYRDVPLPKCGTMLQRYALFTDDDIY